MTPITTWEDWGRMRADATKHYSPVPHEAREDPATAIIWADIKEK